MATFNVGASADDCMVYWDGAKWVINPTAVYTSVGYGAATFAKIGGGMRFQNVTIPQGATINTAYLTLVCQGSRDTTTVKSLITGNDVDDAAAWSTIANYQARRGTIVGGANDNYITTAQVAWDSIPAWLAGNAYDSPSIVSIIQEIVNREGWASGHALALWWDDHDDRSTHGASVYRVMSSWDLGTYDPAALTVTYTEPSTGFVHSFAVIIG